MAIISDSGFRYEVWLSRDTGERIRILDNVQSFEYVKTINGVGAFTVDLPYNFPLSELGIHDGFPDRHIEFWRGALNAKMTLDQLGLIRIARQATGADGFESLSVGGPDINDLIERRIIAYFSGTDQAAKEAEADDVIKEFSEENFGGTATGTRRDWTGAGVSIQGDGTMGPVVNKQASWRNLLTTFDDIAENARGDGTRVYYAMVPVNSDEFQLRTWINQPGQDLTDKVIFSQERGNLDSPELVYDYSQEVTVVYAGGLGRGTARTLAIVTDTDRIYTSIFNRREVFKDARNADDLNSVIDEGKTRMIEGLPFMRFTGDIRSTPSTRYGVDWNLGDRISVNYKGQQFEATVNKVRVRVDRNGREDITAKVENITLSQPGTLLVDTIHTPDPASKGCTTEGPVTTIT